MKCAVKNSLLLGIRTMRPTFCLSLGSLAGSHQHRVERATWGLLGLLGWRGRRRRWQRGGGRRYCSCSCCSSGSGGAGAFAIAPVRIHMFNHMVFTNKTLTACLTDIRFLTSVQAKMTPQISFVIKLFRTLVTFMWFFAGVFWNMFLLTIKKKRNLIINGKKNSLKIFD